MCKYACAATASAAPKYLQSALEHWLGYNAKSSGSLRVVGGCRVKGCGNSAGEVVLVRGVTVIKAGRKGRNGLD